MPPPGGQFGQVNFSGSGALKGMSGQASLFDPGAAAGLTGEFEAASGAAAKLKREIEQLINLQNQLQSKNVGIAAVDPADAKRLTDVNNKLAKLVPMYDRLKKKQAGVNKSMPDWAKAESKATKYLGSLERQVLGVKNLIANNKELQYALGAVAIASGAVGKTFKLATGIIQSLYKGIKTTTEYLLTMPVKLGEWSGKIGNSIRQELVEVIGQAVENTKEFFDLSSNGGSAMTRLGSIASGALGSFQSVNSEMTKMFGFGAQGAANAISTVSQGINSMGAFAEIFANSTGKSDKSIEFYYKMTKGLGMSAEDTKYIVLEAAKNGEHYFETMTRVKESADAASKEFGINRKRLSMGFFELRKDIVQFGHLTEPELMRVVSKATQLGIEVKELSSVFGKFDTFESAAQSAAMLQQTFGMNVDALKLIKAEDPMEIVEMFRQSMMMTGRSFSDLNRHEKSLMASHTGMSAEALKTIMNYRNVGKSYEEIKKQMNDQKPEERQIRAMKDMKSSITEVKKVIEGKGFFANFLEGVQTTIKYNSKLGRAFVRVSQRMEDFYEKGLSLNAKQKKQLNTIFKPLTSILDGLIGKDGPFSKKSFDKLKTSVLTNLSEFVKDVFGDSKGMRMNMSLAQRHWQSKIKKILSMESLMKDQTFIGQIFRSSGKIIGTIVRGIIVAAPAIADGFAQVVNGGLSAIDSFVDGSNTGFGKSILKWLGFDPTKNKETTEAIARMYRSLKRTFIGEGSQEGIITTAFNQILNIASKIGGRIVDGFNNNKKAIFDLTDQLSFGFFNKFMMFAARSPLFSKMITEEMAMESGQQYARGAVKRYSPEQAAAAILDEKKFGNEIGDMADEGQHSLGGSVGEYVKALTEAYQGNDKGATSIKHYAKGGAGAKNNFASKFLDSQSIATDDNDSKTGNMLKILEASADSEALIHGYVLKNEGIHALFNKGVKGSTEYDDFLNSIKNTSGLGRKYTLFMQRIREKLKVVAVEEAKRKNAANVIANAASPFASTAKNAGPQDNVLSGITLSTSGQVLGVGPGADPNTNLDGSTAPKGPDNTSTTFRLEQNEVNWAQRNKYLPSLGAQHKGWNRQGGKWDEKSKRYAGATMIDDKFEGLNFTRLNNDLYRRISAISADTDLMGADLGISKKDLEILMSSQDEKHAQMREEYLKMVGALEGQRQTIITIDGYEIAAIIDNKQNEADVDASRLGAAGKPSRGNMLRSVKAENP